MLRPCLYRDPETGRPCGTPTSRTRCRVHQNVRDARKHNRVYDNPAWKRFRVRTLAAWRAEHGERCPGGGDEHPAHDVVPPDFLTLDHVEGVGRGLFGVTRVLCGNRNSVLGGRAAHQEGRT